jgi:glyoxylate reductase
VLGIYGFGRIGQAVARRALGFGMTVLYCSRTEASRDVERNLKARRVTFEKLLRMSDVISIHAPLNDSTRHRFGAAQLGAMKRDSILINTARGPIVDESAIADALDDGPLFGVGLDVYEDEPRVHESLQWRDDVTILPHLGSATYAARARMAKTAIVDAVRVAQGEAALHPIPELAGT